MRTEEGCRLDMAGGCSSSAACQVFFCKGPLKAKLSLTNMNVCQSRPGPKSIQNCFFFLIHAITKEAISKNKKQKWPNQVARLGTVKREREAGDPSRVMTSFSYTAENWTVSEY
jgi:hypothetical protein